MTKLEIINNALIRVGYGILQSEDEYSNTGELVGVSFDAVIGEVLRTGEFACATKRSELARLATVPAFGYQYEYALPSDSVFVKTVLDGNCEEMLEWEVEGRKLLTNESTVYVQYVYIPLDLQELDEITAMAISLRLAIQIGYAKTENATYINALKEEYVSLMLQNAMSKSSMEVKKLNALAEPDWIESRSYTYL